MLEVDIENITKSDSNFASTFVDHHVLPNITFNEHGLINNSISIPKKVTNLYISYILSPWLRNWNTDFTLNNCSFGSVDLTKNAEPDKYKYSSQSIGCDSRSEFSFTAGSMGKNGVVFVADMSLSVHIDSNYKDVLILCTKPTDVTTLIAEAKYPVNFTQPRKRFVSSLHYNGSNNFLFVNSTKIYQFTEKYSEINYYALFIGRISNDFTINCMKK